MEDQNLLETEQQQQEAVVNAESFKVHPFYRVFESIVKYNISLITHALETEEFDSVAEVTELQRRKKVHEDILNIPDRIIRTYSKNADDKEPNFDPYPTVDEFRTQLVKARRKS